MLRFLLRLAWCCSLRVFSGTAQDCENRGNTDSVLLALDCKIARFLSKMMIAETPLTLDENENSIEYSFALEYPGPAINFSIPRAMPVDIEEIPTASLVVSASHFNGLLLPIVQPIRKKSVQGTEMSSNSVVSSSSVTPKADSDCPDSPRIEVNYWNASKYSEPDDDCLAKLSSEFESSHSLELFEQSKEKLASEIELAEDENEESCESDMISPDWGSADSMLSSSSEIVLFNDEENENKNQLAVTICDPESNEIISEGSSQYETQSIQARPKAQRNGKKGSCYRCLTGNQFTEKEKCIVCGAKYCRKCVLREMGSMPEGRKCVSCIGFHIDESRRESLGKCSRLLKKMLSDMEIKIIMRAEMESLVNQLPPKLVWVNDVPLNKEELFILKSCSNPPKKLKPGLFWYDKVSGFWGQKGKQPCQIISPHLNVGGLIKKDASNGNTKVVINNREITMKELYMLKVAGVPCEGSPSFWLNADGSYQEEGMNNIKGNIWDKGKTKLLCAVLSLPLPHNPTNLGAEEMKTVAPNSINESTIYRLLLVGYNKSGTSTFFKQAKSLYNIPFSKDERENIKAVIQRNLYEYIGILLEGRERFEEEASNERRVRRFNQLDPSDSEELAARDMEKRTTYEIGPRLKAFSDWLLKVMVSGNLEAIFPAATREYAPFIEDLWGDPAFQATYMRRNELELLPGIATYFIDRAVEISKIDYEPSDLDILYAEGISASNGLSDVEFSFPESPQDYVLDRLYEHDPSRRYQLIRVHPSSIGDKCKWLEMFENVDIVLFCVSLTDYDEFHEDQFGNSVNNMLASKKLFESIIRSPTLKKKHFLLILNKFDLFEEKIKQVPLSRCEWFDNFNPLISSNFKVSGSSNGTNTSLAHQAFQYIAVKFKKLFCSYTNNKLFVSLSTGMEADSVSETLRYAREILKWRKEEPAFVSELSSMSIEVSTSC